MISYIKGYVLFVGENYIEVLTGDGVGYVVYVSMKGVEYSVDSSVEMYISMQVREDSQKLYGFNTREDRDMFELLISVSGIGPKIGIAVLCMYSKEEVVSLVSSGDHKSLSKVSGLGNKGAQKIILDLKEKVGTLGIDSVLVDGSKIDDEMMKQLKSALKTLGFSGENLSAYLEKGGEILSGIPDINIEDLVKKVLSGN
jgi:Holliday junction DNA helicase RuvA